MISICLVPMDDHRTSTGKGSLVGGRATPLKNMSSSVGVMTCHLYKNNIYIYIHGKIIQMFQTTSSEIFVEIRIVVLIKNSVGFMQQHVPFAKWEIHCLNQVIESREKNTQETTWLPSCTNMMKNINILQDGFSLC